MLTRVVKLNHGGFRDAAKQILIWALNKKQEFHTSCKNSYYTKPQFYRSRERRSKKWGLDDQYRKKLDFNLNELEPFEKNFYKPHPDVLSRSKNEVDEFHVQHEIKVFGANRSNCPTPILNFQELDLPEKTFNVIRSLNYSQPTPIQSQAWPIALSGLDLVGVSQTGSGKTLGFMLPAIIHVQNQPPLKDSDGPVGVVIAPTRELAQQIYKVAQPFAKSASLKTTCIFGGKKKDAQRLSLRGTHICIATPGRLIDFLNEGSITLARCTYFVLDEADRLLDMGFQPQIETVLNQVRPDRQVTMWSATWPTEVRHLAETYLKDYIGLKFGSVELAANPNIVQRIYKCEEGNKIELLQDILEDIKIDENNKTLIFAESKRRVESLNYLLKKKGYRVAYIHGDISQNGRDSVLQNFRSGYIKFLVGTSVIARGLDISDISHVINFDFPRDIEEYVHVIGRTARNNNPGTSHTLFNEANDGRHAADLIRILEASKQEVPDFLRKKFVRTEGSSFPSRSFSEHRRPMRSRYI